MKTDFSDIKGQEHVKRALEIALAGLHSILLVGPPGAGKTMCLEAAADVAETIGDTSEYVVKTLDTLEWEIYERPLEESAAYLIMAETHPCPCGYLGDPKRECLCSIEEIAAYRVKLGSSNIDRFSIHIEVPAVRSKDLMDTVRRGETGAEIAKRVIRAYQIQDTRQTRNQWLTNAEIEKHCKLDSEGNRLMEMCIDRQGISARVYFSTLKVARTIADLDDSENIRAVHVSEAIQYRVLDRTMK
jgi:magnesium chelatase family protein